jgi:DNA repair protein RadA/Sms
VLGGGIVPGSLVLIGGDPGIGKSTLLLQVAAGMAKALGTVLYVSGEESPSQIRLRSARLGLTGEGVCLLAETDLEEVLAQVERLHPGLLIIDSIQTMYVGGLEGAAGSVSQVRECALRLMNLAKGLNIPVFLVGHVTKDGAIAGPRVLEHIVDTVLYLEGERFHSFRILRAVKNRFGSTNEVGLFEMRGEGMTEVADPAQLLLSQRAHDPIGSALTVAMEGTRPLVVEVQALTSRTIFGLPRRTANGVDYNRLLMIAAVLSRRAGLALGDQDIFVNVVGGLQVEEPAVDLSLAVAIASSCRNARLDPGLVLLGEVGLGGELRAVTSLERRLAEALRLGFSDFLLPPVKGHVPEGARLHQVATLGEAIKAALGR